MTRDSPLFSDQDVKEVSEGRQALQNVEASLRRFQGLGSCRGCSPARAVTLVSSPFIWLSQFHVKLTKLLVFKSRLPAAALLTITHHKFNVILLT